MSYAGHNFEQGAALTPEQDELKSFLESKNIVDMLSVNGVKPLGETKAEILNNLEQQLQQEKEQETKNDALIAKLENYKNNTEDLNAVLNYLGFSEKPAEQEVREFYDSAEFKELYLKAKSLKNPGEKVKATDIGALLKSGTPEQQRKLKLLDNNRVLSEVLWSRSAILMMDQEVFNKEEKADITAFFTKISELPTESQTDLKKLIEAFEKQYPQYKGKGSSEWYQKEFQSQLDQLKNPDLKKLNDFYAQDIKEIYNFVSANIGHAPEWDDIAAEMKKQGLDDLLNIISGNRKANKELWTQTWEKAKEEFESFEDEALQKFTESKTQPRDWEDLDKLAEAFQKTRKRFSGDRRLKYYKDKLEQNKSTKERVWKMDMQDFYHSKLAGIYAQASQNLNKAPEWQDVRKLITDPNLLYLLENTFKPESESQWKQFWEQERDSFNNTEKKALDNFLQTLDPAKLDDSTAVATLYEADNKFKANAWFKSKLEAHKSAEQARMESAYEQTVSSLPDSTIASAMLASFKNAKNFTQRAEWQQQVLAKVPEYTQLITANNQRESQLAASVETHPDLKKELGKIKGTYNEGKKTYNKNFYSPRKHSEALARLSEKTNERERLVNSTISRAENKTFSQIPKLTDKKKLNYEEFRDELKKLNFYSLDPKIRKNEKVRTALLKKNKALHQQWLDHRSLYLEQNKRTQIGKSQSTIRGVMLPKNMPEGIKDYKDFTFALKDKEVYAALPKGVLKNETVRQTAHNQNLKMWEQYQTQQAKVETSEKPESKETINTPELRKAKNIISGVKLTEKLQTQISVNLKDKDPANPNSFTVALREIGVYQGVDKNLWQTLELRELAWQQNMGLQTKYLAVQKNPNTPEASNETENNENNGLPGHYKINWKGLDSRLTPDQKTRGIERFKQMHSRSDIGLQTLMQQFHQPLGSFVLETLAVMPKDRFEKAITALKDVRMEAGKKAQASEWMKVLCESAGLGYLQKEASSAWSQFKQNFSTHFGSSLEASWEITNEEDLQAILPDTDLNDDEEETAEELNAEALDNAEDAEPDDEGAIELGPSVESPDDIILEPEEAESGVVETEIDIPETIIEPDETPDRGEALPVENTDAEVADTSSSETIDLPVNEGDLNINESHLDTPPDALIDEAFEDEMVDIETGELVADNASLEASLPETDILEEPTDEELETELEGSATDQDLEAVETEVTDTENDELLAESADDDSGEVDILEPDVIDKDLEAAKEIDSDENLESSDTKQGAETVDTEEQVDSENLVETPEDATEIQDETEDGKVAEKVDNPEPDTQEPAQAAEIIPLPIITPAAQTAQTQAATQSWKSFVASEETETPLPANSNEIPKWLRDNQELKAEDMDKLTPKEIETLLQNPLYRRRLQTHLRQQKALNPRESHFFTGVYLGTYFSQSMTVVKFLEQIKNYCLYSLDLEVKTHLTETDKSFEISKDQAQALFTAFTDKLHSAEDIKHLELSFNTQQLSVKAQTNKQPATWIFPLQLESAA